MGKLEKATLRKKYRLLRKSCCVEQRMKWNDAIVKQVLALPMLTQVDAILCYMPLPDEVDTTPVFEALWDLGKTVYAPRCINVSGDMDFFQVCSMADFAQGSYGILEPIDGCKALSTELSMLCILPGLSFSADGYRLGYGKGYYDRFLAKKRAIKVGICYNLCMSQTLPHEDYDQRMDWLITETATKNISNSNK